MADKDDMVPESDFDVDVNLSTILPWSTIHCNTALLVVCNCDSVLQMQPHQPLHSILGPKRKIVKQLATCELIVPIPYRLVYFNLGPNSFPSSPCACTCALVLLPFDADTHTANGCHWCFLGIGTGPADQSLPLVIPKCCSWMRGVVCIGRPESRFESGRAVHGATSWTVVLCTCFKSDT